MKKKGLFYGFTGMIISVMKTTKGWNQSFLLGMISMVLAFGLALTGCSTLLSAATGETKATDEAAKLFVGANIKELLVVGSPRYAQSAGSVERYAFYNWIVRKAAGDVEAKAPVAYSEALMVIFNCTNGVISSYELRADQSSYFDSW
ncbi:hypothetical protein FACS1894164_15630 [Spirochaetia bacterium]|nr:hypothetical protein FACS1894164_15630 [Spirochaetia bacterium]